MNGPQTPPFKCIATGVELTQAEDSKAHVLPNAIGGRLKPKGVLSRQGNTLIGDLIESPFIKQYQSLISVLGGKRQRGQHPDFKVEGEDGKSYLMRHDGSTTLAAPEYRHEGDFLHLSARTKAELNDLLMKAKKEYPETDTEGALQGASLVETPTPSVTFHMNVGPDVLFPVAFAAAATFNAWKGLPVHPFFKAYLQQLKGGNKKLPPDTFYWEPEHPWLDTPHAGTHTVCTVLSRRKAQVLTIVRLVGLPSVAILTDYNGSRNRVVSSTVDIIKGELLYIVPNAQYIVNQNWSETHKLGEAAIMQLIKSRADEALSLAGLGRI